MTVLNYIITHIKPYKWLLGGLLLAAIINTADTIIKPILIQQIIDKVSGGGQYDLWYLFIIYGIIQFALVLISWPLEDYCTVRFYTLVNLNIIREFINKFYYYPYNFFQNNLTGNIVSKVSDSSKIVPELVGAVIEEFLPLVVMITVWSFLLLKIHPIFTILTLIWFMIFVFYTVHSTNFLLKKITTFAEERSKIVAYLADFITNILNVKLFAKKADELKKFAVLEKEYIENKYKQNFHLRNFYVIQGIYSSIYIMVILYCLIYAYQNNLGITAGDFAFVIFSNYRLTTILYKLSHTFRKFITEWGTLEQALTILNQVKPLQDSTDAKELVIKQANISFKHVTFQHPNAQTPLFVDLSVMIPAKQKVGLVGYSGSGKSTFISLLLRLWDIKSGNIEIANQNIAKLTQDSLRQNISLIPQDPILFHRSLLDNIKYGKLSASEEEIINATKRADAHEFIDLLPYGYNSLVGERGVKLSGGQRQRIAIARAILKDAPILILDEATSNLDSITEANIQSDLLKFIQDKTTLVIAHRLSTLLNMDRILVFDKGKIIQDGTHSALILQDGIYKDLWDAQIGGFLPDKKQI